MAFESLQQQRRLERILETAPMIVFVYDLQQQRTLYSNCGLRALLGYSPAELERPDIAVLIHPDDRALLRASAVQLAQAGDDDVVAHECRLRHKDGSWRWMYQHSVVFERDEHGQVKTILGTAIDITGRKEADIALQAANARLEQQVAERTASLEQANLALQQQEQVYRTMLQHLPNSAVFLIDQELRFLVAEGTALRQAGFQPEQITGARLPDVLAGNDLAMLQTYYQRILQGEAGTSEQPYSDRYYAIQAIPIADEQGSVRAAMVLAQDITERRQAEQALRESEKRFRTLFSSAPVGVAVADINGFCYLTNPAFQRMLGYSAEELATMNFARLTHPDDLLRENALVTELLDGTLATYELEKRYIRKDGSVIWVHLQGMAAFEMLPPPATGFVVVSDITERKQIERQLRHSRDLLRTLFDGLPDPLLLIDRSETVLSCNQRFAALLRLHPDAVVGLPWSQVHHRLSQHGALALVSETVQDGTSREERIRLAQHDGQVHVFDVRTLPLLTSEQPLERVILHMVDVTEQLQLQARVIEHERFVANSLLAASVAHEINTPLQTVAYALHFARHAAADEITSYLDSAQAEIERAGRIVAQFLDLYRPDNQKPQSIEINRLLERLILLLGKRMREQGIAFEAYLDPDLPILLARPDDLSQVLLNLLMNALEAMPTGGRLRVSTRFLDGSTPQIEFLVSDTGVGMDAEFQRRIFEPFVSGKHGGTGLGLVICQQLVQQYHGTIRVISQPAQGSTFIVTLPVK